MNDIFIKDYNNPIYSSLSLSSVNQQQKEQNNNNNNNNTQQQQQLTINQLNNISDKYDCNTFILIDEYNNNNLIKNAMKYYHTCLFEYRKQLHIVQQDNILKYSDYNLLFTPEAMHYIEHLGESSSASNNNNNNNNVSVKSNNNSTSTSNGKNGPSPSIFPEHIKLVSNQHYKLIALNNNNNNRNNKNNTPQENEEITLENYTQLLGPKALNNDNNNSSSSLTTTTNNNNNNNTSNNNNNTIVQNHSIYSKQNTVDYVYNIIPSDTTQQQGVRKLLTVLPQFPQQVQHYQDNFVFNKRHGIIKYDDFKKYYNNLKLNQQEIKIPSSSSSQQNDNNNNNNNNNQQQQNDNINNTTTTTTNINNAYYYSIEVKDPTIFNPKLNTPHLLIENDHLIARKREQLLRKLIDDNYRRHLALYQADKLMVSGKQLSCNASSKPQWNEWNQLTFVINSGYIEITCNGQRIDSQYIDSLGHLFNIENQQLLLFYSENPTQCYTTIDIRSIHLDIRKTGIESNNALTNWLNKQRSWKCGNCNFINSDPDALFCSSCSGRVDYFIDSSSDTNNNNNNNNIYNIIIIIIIKCYYNSCCY
eukprot:UN01084